MLKYLFAFISLLQILSCTSTSSEKTDVSENVETSSADSTGSANFFPVTNYIKGQINDIRLKGVNPMLYITQDKEVDSAWLKSENFEQEMKAFLETTIDTSNLTQLFSEKRFLDQTLNAYTFTYDPKTTLPDSLQLQHWDVYVDPTTNKVKRIYIIRKTSDNKQQQLTWQSDKWCKIVTIGTDKNQNSFVEKEVLIKWDF